MTKPSSMSRRLALPASGLIALCAFVHACGGGGGGNGGSPPVPSPPPPTGFVSTSQYPSDSSINVSRLPIIVLGFNDVVNPATMNANTVQLLQGLAPIATNLSYNACNNRIQMIPTAALDGGTPYTISLTSGLQDDDATGLTAMSTTFTTTASTDVVRPTFTMAGYIGTPGDTNMAPPNQNQTISVTLDWADAADDSSAAGNVSYRVYVSTLPACFDLSAPFLTTPPGALQAVITGRIPRTPYAFLVSAVDEGFNESVNSTSINVTTFTSLQTNLFPLVAPQGGLCQSCHIPPGGAAVMVGVNMNYSTAQTTFNSWVNQTSFCATAGGAAPNAFGIRVVPGQPLDSFLWNKLSLQNNNGVAQVTPACGAQMPNGLPPLSAADLDVFFDWITEGALDN